MCGIAGFRSHQSPALGEDLYRMLKTIGHRGPDSFSGVAKDGVALGTARLSIVDLNGGVQPAVSDDQKVVVIFNGEIFNYEALREGLVQKGISFKTRSEVETLLQLYLVHGKDFVSLIEGQFAIAVWDGRSRQFILYRDRFGIRPLFWSLHKNEFSFASEIKALFALGRVNAKINREALVQTLRFWTCVGDTTAFEGVQQVPAGHYLTVTDNQTTLKRYWELPLSNAGDTLELSSDEAYFEAFSEQLEAAVSRQRMADVPVASYLSGGIDSSVIASILNSQDSGSLKTYSVTFNDPEYDESEAQEMVAKNFGFDHTSVNIEPGDISKIFPQVVWQAETPLFRTAPSPLFGLSQKVHESGIKVVMTGEGADEILLGYDLFRESAIRRFWGRQPQSQWRGSLFKRLYAYLPQFRNPRYFNLILDFYRPTLDADDRHYPMAVRWANGTQLEKYFDPGMRSFADNYDPVQELEKWLPQQYDSGDDIDRAQSVEVHSLLGNYLLSSQGDRMSMAHAVEGRYPYLDDTFVKFASRLPRGIKLRGLKDKYVLRNAYRGTIPEMVRNRPKVAYQAPDMLSFCNNGQLPDYAEELLSPERIKETGFFDSEKVSQLVAKGRATTLSRIGNRDNMAFVSILSTMLLDDIYVRKNWNLKSDVKTPEQWSLNNQWQTVPQLQN
ncbi:MAG: asparagine synthase (glutamine-hydrolyzing) [Rhodospirillales bacterium]|nr:asparagine synthase (glutamine-hydrolyzing) [Rhodospirillales bacterium]